MKDNIYKDWKKAWRTVTSINLDNITDSELYALVHSTKDFRDKVSKYYNNK